MGFLTRAKGCYSRRPARFDLELLVKPIYVLAVVGLVLPAVWFVMVFAGEWQASAPSISAAQIQAMQDLGSNDHFVIVDVREDVETNVSIIPGAITQAEFEKRIEQHRDKVVVAYCTVGYRSGVYAAELCKQGWDARNYQGSILDWCSKQLPVATLGGSPTKRVHTYDSSYALASGYIAVHHR